MNTAKDELKSINVFSSAFAEIALLDCLKFRQNLGISYSVNDRLLIIIEKQVRGKHLMVVLVKAIIFGRI